MSLVGLRAGDIVTTLYAFCTGAGTLVTYTGMGLFRATGVRLGSTADIKASLVANTILSGALAAPVTIDADGGYYLAILSTATTTQPAFVRASGTSQGVAVGTGVRKNANSQGGLANLNGNLTPADNGVWYWIACA